MLVIDKAVYSDDDINFNISMQDSRYDHNYNTVWGRIKRAFKILFGKPIYYNDVNISNPAKFISFVEELNSLVSETIEQDNSKGEDTNASAGSDI